MPRTKTHTEQSLSQAALQTFWQRGFYATSVDDLVKATGASRHSIYADFGGKHELFLSCFDQYQETVVTPAFARVEAAGADFASVAEYFEVQISLAEASDGPRPGCFVANAATEVAPHDTAVLARVQAHNDRLISGFRNVLRTEASATLSDEKAADIAMALCVFTNGLWSASRTVSDAGALRRAVTTYLGSVKREIA